MEDDDQIEGIILGCTEYPLVITEDKLSSGIPVFNTTKIHIDYAVKVQIGEMSLEDYLPISN